MNELLTDYTSGLPDIVRSDVQNHGPKYKKINVYNRSITTPLQKIWLKTPKMKIFKPTFNPNNDGKSVSLTILLGPNTANIKKFKNFIKKLEQRIASLLDLTNDQSIRSSIRSVDGFPDNFTVKMPYVKEGNCYEFLFHAYNDENKRVSVKTLDSGTYVSCYIELTDVWISDVEFGFNWNVLQMKLYPEFDFSRCLFVDDETELKPIQQEQECYHCMFCPNKHVRTHYCVNAIQSTADVPLLPLLPLPPPPPPPQILAQKPLQIVKNSAPQLADVKSAFRPTVSDLLSVKLRPVSERPNGPQNPTNNNNNLTEIKNNLKPNYSMDIPTIMRSVLNEKSSDGFKKTDEEYKKLIKYLITQ
jgi:hypothetical protein